MAKHPNSKCSKPRPPKGPSTTDSKYIYHMELWKACVGPDCFAKEGHRIGNKWYMGNHSVAENDCKAVSLKCGQRILLSGVDSMLTLANTDHRGYCERLIHTYQYPFNKGEFNQRKFLINIQIYFSGQKNYMLNCLFLQVTISPLEVFKTRFNTWFSTIGTGNHLNDFILF